MSMYIFLEVRNFDFDILTLYIHIGLGQKTYLRPVFLKTGFHAYKKVNALLKLAPRHIPYLCTLSQESA
jgi:hypothetical protein